MVLWLWNERGAHRIEDRRVVPTFFLHAPPPELPAIRRRIEILDGVREVREVPKRIALEDDERRPVLEIVPRHYRDIRNLAHILDSNGGYVDHRLFNVDLRFSQRYAIEHDIFPMGLLHYANGVWRAGEEHFAPDYPLPALRETLLAPHAANPAGLPPTQDKLPGARVAQVAVEEEQARLTTGTAFSAMQVNQAYHDGCLVVWKKNRPEDFKDAENLLRGDRGGFTFEPEVGVHEGLYELDFSSLYPSIMVKYNISAETLDCACCPTDGVVVPELRYHLCTRRVGIVGRVLKPLIERRRYYKKMKKEPGPLQDVYTGRDTILKWTLVTCFSADTLVPYKLDGEYYIDRIEDVVNRYLPNETGTIECKDELRVFGFDTHLHPEEKRVARVMKAEGPKELLKVKIKGNRELLVTPNHRFFVFKGSKELEVRTADELRAGDLIPIATIATWEMTTSATINVDGATAQEFEDLKHRKTVFEFLPIISIENTPYENPYVYCFEVEDDLHGFVTADGTFVGQSFGYQGYKNARFGRIECHEAINAFARNILVRTMEIAESHGYEVVHGIVDSVWLRPKPNADPIEKVREHIAGSIGLPIELEGRYKWIVFLPCKTTGVGALNRYYGLFQDDEFKLRGIELRKHDTPEFINICQEAMLGELSLASTAAEFREHIPKAVDILRWTAKCILDRTIPVHQFILTKSVSRTLPEYVVLTATAAALKQMEKRGFAVEPGESVRYVLLDARARDSERKVRVAEFLQGDEEPDAWEYIHLLCRSGQTLLAPFGHTEENLVRRCEDLSDVSIASLPEQAITIQEDYKSIGESRSRARGGVGYKKPWRVLDEEEMPSEISGDR